MTALAEDWAVEVISWLPEAEQPLGRPWVAQPFSLIRGLLLSAVRPLTVAYVQSLAPRWVARRLQHGDLVLFMTDRAVPVRAGAPYVIDFIDDLGGAALRRAGATRGPLAWVLRWEGQRLRRLDARLALGAARAVAISERDAAAIGSEVGTVPAAIGTGPMEATGTKVVFTGNLFYPPNLDAATWVCEALAPEIARRGVDPGILVVAGRRPPAALISSAAGAGVCLLADVPDLDETLSQAAVVLAPVVFGSGVQNKVLDAVGALRPCVLTPFVNEPLGLVDRESAMIRTRDAVAFADAVIELLGDRELRLRMAACARDRLAGHSQAAVERAWRHCLDEVRQNLGI